MNARLEELGRKATVTVKQRDDILVDNEVLTEKDEQGNFIWTKEFTFTLIDKESTLFDVTATTGSTIQFIITETNDGGADSTTVNGVTTHSVYGFLTTGSAYEFVNTFNGGGGDNGDGGNTGKEEIPTDPDEEIDEPEVPKTEPTEEPTEKPTEEPIVEPEVPLIDVPGETIEEPEVPLGDAPKTGDSSNAVPFVVLMMVAVAGLMVTRRKFN